MNITFIIAIAIFIITFILIIGFDKKIPPTISALIGGIAMLFTGVLSQEEAYKAVDNEVIFLLVGMMIIVHIISETGVFQWLAIRMSQLAKGEPVIIMSYLILTTAVLSAILDNVTTVLLIAPISILIAEELKISAIPFLITEALASNIGGTATLIGDPPNILIGTKAGLSFNEFIINMGPVILINLVVFIITAYFLFRKKMSVTRDLKARIMDLDSSKALKNKTLLIKCLVVMAFVIIGFVLKSFTGIGPGIVALTGAVVSMFITAKSPADMLKHVEWDTLYFFIGLFILVEGVVRIGLLKLFADAMINFTGGNLAATSMIILWASGFLSSIVNNIPYAATLIPMIKDGIIPNLVQPGMDAETIRQVIAYPLWWSLVLGACLGGNGTLVGASANVIVAGIAGKSGKTISFLEFTKYGMIILLESMIISSVYIFVRYLH